MKKAHKINRNDLYRKQGLSCGKLAVDKDRVIRKSVGRAFFKEKFPVTDSKAIFERTGNDVAVFGSALKTVRS